jgi:beta-glucosidase
MEWFDGLELAGEAIHTETLKRPAGFFWMGTPPQAVTMGQFSLRLRGAMTVDDGGRHTFSLISLGRSRLLLDGNLLVDNWTRQARGSSFYGFGSTEVKAEADLAVGTTHEVVVEFACPPGAPSAGLTVGLQQPVPGDLLERAVSAASDADLAVVVVGSSAEWESEGHDRLSLELPGRQDELIARVAAANPRTVVVVNTGSPHALPWCQLVPAVMQIWYGGQEMGHGVTDVIFGDTDPGGRLPTTFPVRLEDSPAYLNYPGEYGAVLYGEGIFAGYRGYDRLGTEPRFCFGHGLTYTSFDYGDLEVTSEASTLRCRVPVTNTGSRRGREVVQLYVHHLASAVSRPERELKAFAKVVLEPAETATVSLSVERSALATWDSVAARWVVEAGDVEFLVGRSSRDLRAAATVRIE